MDECDLCILGIGIDRHLRTRRLSKDPRLQSAIPEVGLYVVI